MAAFCRVYNSRHLQADCQESVSALEPYARQSSMGCLYLFNLTRLDLTWQALQTDAYNHYTAIYCLLLEKLRQHRSQLAAAESTRGADGRRRRPSSIADQAMMNSSATPRPVLASTRRGPFSQTTDCVTAGAAAAAAAAAVG